MVSAPSLQSTVSFPLIVDSDFSLTAQSVLRGACGAQIRSIELEVMPDRHEHRLWITLAASACGRALHAVILGLPAAQFGAIKPVKAGAVSLMQAA